MYAYKALINKQNYATLLLHKTKEAALQDALLYISMSRLNPEYDILCAPKKVDKADKEPWYVVEKYEVTALYECPSEIDCGIEGYYDETFTIHIIEYYISE